MSNRLISLKRMFSQWVAPNTKPVVPHPGSMDMKMIRNVERGTVLLVCQLYTALNLRFTERSRARFNLILSNRVSCDCSNLSGLK